MQAAPPGILDLIPWGPSPPPHHEEAFDLSPHIWSHFPDNLLHSVLAWLPLQSVLRFRCVCKQWKALFASPAFHHFASHRTYVPPLVFFIGSSTSFNLHDDDDAHDDNGYVYEDDKDHVGYVSDDNGSNDSHCDDHLMERIEHENIHDVIRYGDQVDMHAVMTSADHEDMLDLMSYDDHGDMDDVISYADPWDMRDGMGLDDHGAIHDDDEDFSNGQAHDKEAPEERTDVEPLLLIFDCKSESWCRPLTLPLGYRKISNGLFLSRFHACTSQEQVMIPTVSSRRFFLFNPASPPCKELPRPIAIQEWDAIGFVEERATLPSAVTWSNLVNPFSMSNEKGLHEQNKILQVVAVGHTVHDYNIVESFDSLTGSWHVIGCLPYSDDFIFHARRMVYCNGCFYALLSGGFFMMNNFMVGQNMKWEVREFPDPPNGDGYLNGRYTEVLQWDLVATRESVFLVGTTVIEFPNTFGPEDWDIVIWQFHPHALANACWELHVYMPRGLWRTFIFDTHLSIIEYIAHGHLIFVMVPGRRRFLIYDVSQKLWRLSTKCKYLLEVMNFAWEPLLRN